MGQQQILLIVLGIILVGIAIVIGMTIFRTQTTQSNVDAIIMDMNNLGAMAYQYRMRFSDRETGAVSYEGFDDYFLTLPEGMRNNPNAIYTIHDLEPDLVIFQGESKTQMENDELVKRWLSIDEDGKFVVYTQDPLID